MEAYAINREKMALGECVAVDSIAIENQVSMADLQVTLPWLAEAVRHCNIGEQFILFVPPAWVSKASRSEPHLAVVVRITHIVKAQSMPLTATLLSDSDQNIVEPQDCKASKPAIPAKPKTTLVSRMARLGKSVIQTSADSTLQQSTVESPAASELDLASAVESTFPPETRRALPEQALPVAATRAVSVLHSHSEVDGPPNGLLLGQKLDAILAILEAPIPPLKMSFGEMMHSLRSVEQELQRVMDEKARLSATIESQQHHIASIYKTNADLLEVSVKARGAATE